jgi:hypothetical protein
VATYTSLDLSNIYKSVYEDSIMFMPSIWGKGSTVYAWMYTNRYKEHTRLKKEDEAYNQMLLNLKDMGLFG